MLDVVSPVASPSRLQPPPSDVADHPRDAFEYVRVDAGRHYNLLI